jgi:hypothetical protein
MDLVEDFFLAEILLLQGQWMSLNSFNRVSHGLPCILMYQPFWFYTGAGGASSPPLPAAKSSAALAMSAGAQISPTIGAPLAPVQNSFIPGTPRHHQTSRKNHHTIQNPLLFKCHYISILINSTLFFSKGHNQADRHN